MIASHDRALQVLRELDKLEKLGLDGVCAMLGDGLKDASGAFNKGVGLHPLQIGMIRLFFSKTLSKAEDKNDLILQRIRSAIDHLSKIRNRVDMMACLEETACADGRTAWNDFLAMPANSDNTWSTPPLRRPQNIAWALDDMCAAIQAAQLPAKAVKQ
jgi:hypothetical protein